MATELPSNSLDFNQILISLVPAFATSGSTQGPIVYEAALLCEFGLLQFAIASRRPFAWRKHALFITVNK